MQRIAHGVNTAQSAIESTNGHNLTTVHLESAAAAAPAAAPEPLPGTVPFSLMFPKLTNDDLLTRSDTILEDLARLGASMQDISNDTQFNSSIPAAYTYFAQFIDHDIVFTDVQKAKGQTDSALLADEKLSPWSKKEIDIRIRNKRTVPLQLESVYGDVAPDQPPLHDCKRFCLGIVCPHHGRPPHKDQNNDLLRLGPSRNPKQDRVACINDPRNDSNLIVSQIHVAFLRAHNAIADTLGCSFKNARLTLLNHYQWMVYHDILPRFVRAQEINAARDNAIFNPPNGVPLEFAVAAFRFGHSLVRRMYYLNDNYQREPLQDMFMLTVLSNDMKATPGAGCLGLPGDKIIQWRKFLGDEKGRNVARKIRPQMVEPLFTLLDEANVPVNGERRLAVQDLKRGYMLGLPTGQALARIMNVDPLTPDDLNALAVSDEQREALKRSDFLDKTPLWFYILAEGAKQSADAAKAGVTEEAIQNKDKLGPVGGRIVAEAITGFIRQTPDSFLNTGLPPADAFCLQPGQFSISDLLRLAGVLEPM